MRMSSTTWVKSWKRLLTPDMKPLISSNIYAPRGKVAVVGTCLVQMQPEAFVQVEAMADQIYSLCLEETHVNMAITKLGAALSTGQIEKLIFATVDRSPHCTQMHYMKHELERMLPLRIPVENYVAVENRLIRLDEETLELSKTLSKLQFMGK